MKTVVARVFRRRLWRGRDHQQRIVSRSQAREMSGERTNLEKKIVARVFVRCGRSEAAKNRVKPNRQCADDSITQMA
jgi:hypothetical protein